MAIEVMSEVITARRGPWKGGDLLVLLMLASYADPDGSKIFPRVATLAAACRMNTRNTQICLKALLADGVLLQTDRQGRPLSKATGRPGLFNEYRIDLERLQILQGCKLCRGVICGDEGCNPTRGRVQNPVAHIDKRPLPVLDTSYARAAGSVDKPGGAREAWEAIRVALGVKFQTHADKGSPEILDGVLVVSYPSEFRAGRAQEVVDQMSAAIGMPVTIRLAIGANVARRA